MSLIGSKPFEFLEQLGLVRQRARGREQGCQPVVIGRATISRWQIGVRPQILGRARFFNFRSLQRDAGAVRTPAFSCSLAAIISSNSPAGGGSGFLEVEFDHLAAVSSLLVLAVQRLRPWQH